MGGYFIAGNVVQKARFKLVRVAGENLEIEVVGTVSDTTTPPTIYTLDPGIFKVSSKTMPSTVFVNISDSQVIHAPIENLGNEPQPPEVVIAAPGGDGGVGPLATSELSERKFKNWVTAAQGAVGQTYGLWTPSILEVTGIRQPQLPSGFSLTYRATFRLKYKDASVKDKKDQVVEVSGGAKTANGDTPLMTVGAIGNMIPWYADFKDISVVQADFMDIVQKFVTGNNYVKVSLAKSVLLPKNPGMEQPFFDFWDANGKRLCSVGAIDSKKVAN